MSAEVVNWLFVGLTAVSAVLNVGMVVYYSVLLRRARRLNLLLGAICTRAFVRQHLPYWKPWADVFGYNLEIRVRPTVNPPSDSP